RPTRRRCVWRRSERSLASTNSGRAGYDLYLTHRLSGSREEAALGYGYLAWAPEAEEHYPARASVCVAVRSPTGIPPTATSPAAEAQPMPTHSASGRLAGVARQCRVYWALRFPARPNRTPFTG